MLTSSNIVPSTDDNTSMKPIIDAMDELWKEPVLIGSLHGDLVFLYRATEEISIGQLRFSLDHPYVQGTKIWSEALKHLVTK